MKIAISCRQWKWGVFQTAGWRCTKWPSFCFSRREARGKTRAFCTNFITEALERRGNVAIGTDPHGLTSGLTAPLVDTGGDQERVIADAFNGEFNTRLTYPEIQQMWLVNIASAYFRRQQE